MRSTFLSTLRISSISLLSISVKDMRFYYYNIYKKNFLIGFGIWSRLLFPLMDVDSPRLLMYSSVSLLLSGAVKYSRRPQTSPMSLYATPLLISEAIFRMCRIILYFVLFRFCFTSYHFANIWFICVWAFVDSQFIYLRFLAGTFLYIVKNLFKKTLRIYYDFVTIFGF